MTAYSQLVSEQDGTWIIQVHGQVDAHTAPQLEEALGHLLAAGRNQVVLDLQDLGYISSAGLGVLTGALGSFREQGGDLKLARTPPKAFRVLDLLGFTQLFSLYECCEDAIAAFRVMKAHRPS